MALENLTKSESREVVLGTFSVVVQLYDNRSFACHETAHHLGIWLYSYLTNVKQALGYANQLCDGGVFHGIFQSYFSSEHEAHHVDTNKISLSELCSTREENVNLLDEWNCTHGIGHGLTDLYDDNTTAAVARCNDLVIDWRQYSCAKGVFMENNDFFLAAGKADFSENDIYYPCDTITEKFAPECYIYHAEYIFNKNNRNVSASFDQCDNITPRELVKYCYFGMGRAISVKSYRNVEQGIANCHIGKQSSYHADCLRGLERAVLKLRTGTDAGFQLCGEAGPDFKSECYDISGQWVKLLYPNQYEEWERQCSKGEDGYLGYCMNANPESWISER